MTDNVTNQLILEHLKTIQAKITQMSTDIADIKDDMRGLKAHMAGFMQSEVRQDGDLAALRKGLERIERRLELND